MAWPPALVVNVRACLVPAAWSCSSWLARRDWPWRAFHACSGMGDARHAPTATCGVSTRDWRERRGGLPWPLAAEASLEVARAGSSLTDELLERIPLRA